MCLAPFRVLLIGPNNEFVTVFCFRHFPAGRVLDSRVETIQDWNAGRIPILFAHPASAGHGLNLQDGGNIIVFFGHWWNLVEHDQIIERIGPVRQLQSGYNRPVFIHYIVAKGTVDAVVCARRESKREVQELLLAHMKASACQTLSLRTHKSRQG